MKALFYFFLFLLPLVAQRVSPNASKGIRYDESVIYADELVDKPLKFQVIEARPIFSSKTGSRSIGVLRVGTVCELIGFDHRAFKVKAQAQHGQVSGWVSPHALKAGEEGFREDFKKFYEREVLVREFIKNKEIAIGMTPEEVEKVLGKPSKTSLRQTAEGTTSLYEYLTIEQIKHFQTFQDPSSGRFYRELSHTTEEITNRVGVEFKDKMVSVIEKEEDNSRRRRSVPVPIYLDFVRFF